MVCSIEQSVWFILLLSLCIESSQWTLGVCWWSSSTGTFCSCVPVMVDRELLPSSSSDLIAGIDDEVVVVIDESSSVLNRKEPVELTPLELCTLRKELVINDESFFSMACSLFHDIRLVMVPEDNEESIGCMEEDGDDNAEALLACVPVPSAVK